MHRSSQATLNHCLSSISAERQGDYIIYKFRDNGIDIPSEYKERVFGLFERLDANTAGSGVGLVIVRRIVEAHAGSVWIESAGHNKGTTVLLKLSSAKLHAPNGILPDNDPSLPRAAS
jgi:signal transduction histidine kinase